MNIKRRLTVEGKLYGEVAAWMTIVGIISAAAALLFSLFFRGGVVDYTLMLGELLDGKGERAIWRTASSLHAVPSEFWFFRAPLSWDSIIYAGIIFGCYGSVLGMIAMLGSMFRSREALFYKKGLYTVLTLTLTTILLLAATGIVSLRN